MPLNQPSLSDLKEWLGLPTDGSDSEDDAVLQRALDASLAAQARIVTYPLDSFGAETFSDDLITAIFYRATRAASRRNSPEAVIGVTGTDGDLVGTRVPPGDPDVTRYESPYITIVTA